MRILISFLYFLFGIVGCTTHQNQPKCDISYPFYFPRHIPAPERNVTTLEGIALGKQLFFDSILSMDGKISCATCHQPELSFSDNKKFSIGHSGVPLQRNTPPLINLAWSNHFFWDGGVKNLESLSYAALISEHEMNANLSLLCDSMNQNQAYKNMFEQAFQIDSISSQYMTRALAQYLRSLTNFFSKYDSVMLSQSTFSEEESNGFDVFKRNCAGCHPPPLFTDNIFHDNGLKHDFSDENLYASTGRFRITMDSSDLGKFKTPTLRNLSKTAPYMHDGRFLNLNDVINHYHHTKYLYVTDSLKVDIDFSQLEQNQLLTFLYCLTDAGSNE